MKIVFILLALIIVSAISVFISQKILVEKTFQYNIGINVVNATNRIGINVTKETDVLPFGTMPPGSTSSKNITLSNMNVKPRKIIIKLYGEMKDWTIVSKNNFVIEGGRNETVKVAVIVPENARAGSYSGKIKVIFERLLF